MLRGAGVARATQRRSLSHPGGYPNHYATTIGIRLLSEGVTFVILARHMLEAVRSISAP